MSELFKSAADIDYPILDADSHVNEPPELWQDSVPSKWKERAPRLVHTDDGDIWEFDKGRETWPMGLTATAGQSYFQFNATGNSYEKMRPGSFDPEARLADMDVDGIYAQVLYPSVTLKGAKIYSDERELQIACVRAYNEWLLSFCSNSNGRLIPQAIIPTTGIDDAVAELEGALKDGHRGAIISAFPNGSLQPSPDDARFWQVAVEADIPIAVHIGSFGRWGAPAADGENQTWAASLAFLSRAAWAKAGGQTIDVASDLIFSGVFEKFPGVKLVLVEANIGWIPTLVEQADDVFRRYRWWTGAHEEMSEMPSEIFHRNFWATFLIDRAGVEMRHLMNLDHIMWSTDYPHSGCDWPESMLWLDRNFHGVPANEVKKMLHDNCKALYGLDDIPDAKPRSRKALGG